MTQNGQYTYLGKGRKIIDGLEKITGAAQYAGDLNLPNMLHARPVLSPYAHANIVSIDLDAARAVSGVVAVLTAQDLPSRDRLIVSRNSAILAKEKVVFRGQPVVVVVAESEAAAQDGADAVVVEYEQLPAVVAPLMAMQDDTPAIWPNGVPKEGVDLTAAHAAVGRETEERQSHAPNVHEETHHSRGDVVRALAEASHVVEHTYTTSPVHQSYIEPHASVAEPVLGGGVTIYTSTQGQYMVRDEVARLVSLPKGKVRVVPMTVGGGFGAKYGIIDPLVAAIALTVGRPVRLVLTRSEDFLTTTPSPGSIITLTTGVTADGQLTALKAHVVLDNGAFPFALGGIVSVLIGGYYRCDNVQIDIFEVLTNKPQAGAYRAPGAPQATFALESNIDEHARELGMDPIEFRLKNAVAAGDLMGNNDPWPEIGLRHVLETLRDHPAYRQARDWRLEAGKNRQASSLQAPASSEGVGIAVGGWPGGISPAAAVCRVDTDGTVRVHVGSVDISGVNSSLVLVAAEVLQVPPDQIELVQGDTRSGPYAGASGGSQTTYSVSAAVANAAESAKRQLLELASAQFEASMEDLELVNGAVQVKGVPGQAIAIGELAEKSENTNGGPGPIVGEGRSALAQSAPGFVAHLVRVRVDAETGQVTPLRYVSVQDVGFALNPMLVEGQIQGGSLQGLGFGLHEAMHYDERGQLLSASFMDYDIPKFDTSPPIESVIVQNPSKLNRFGVRGVGEPPITAGAAALANAVRDAVGARVTELPIRSEVLWRSLHER